MTTDSLTDTPTHASDIKERELHDDHQEHLNISRYRRHTSALQDYFSEYGYIQMRVRVEIEWLIHLTHPKKPLISSADETFLRTIYQSFSEDDALEVKKLEGVTNHDVKAIEYYIRNKIKDDRHLNTLSEWIHFGLTSDDVNNCAHGLMHKESWEKVVRPKLRDIESMLASLTKEYHASPLMARTHGQPATPTTFGKEMGVFLNRIMDIREEQLDSVKFKAKLNGAVGCFNAFVATDSSIDWPAQSRSFVRDVLGLTYQPVSTQIEPHDYLAFYFRGLQSLCGPYIDLCNDSWLYISNDILKLKVVSGEIGSSTMPHKVNPINFENAEANLGIANALMGHLASKLQISRWQRDLSDSATLRGVGTAFGHLCVGLESLKTGLAKISFNEVKANSELDQATMLLAEPIQTIMRVHGIQNSYEKLKDLTRGNADQAAVKANIELLLKDLSESIPENAIQQIRGLTPSTYIGCAPQIAEEVYDRWSSSH